MARIKIIDDILNKGVLEPDVKNSYKNIQKRYGISDQDMMSICKLAKENFPDAKAVTYVVSDSKSDISYQISSDPKVYVSLIAKIN